MKLRIEVEMEDGDDEDEDDSVDDTVLAVRLVSSSLIIG